jgi:endonuclease/exonuclease/phosphatase family metal-dependent hydrolase
MGRALAEHRPDIVLFQEIRAQNETPERVQTASEFVHALGLDSQAFGMNYRGKSSQHGNAIFARRSILHFENCDLTVSRLEKRGLLTAECELQDSGSPARARSIRLFCTHLDLTKAGRMKQLARLAQEIERHLEPKNEPYILAGDFNDWNLEGDIYLKERLGVQEAHEVRFGELPKTFPSLFPVVRLDRVYFKGLTVREARVLRGPFQFLSDHRPLLVDFHL